jgi:hypothetical protein
MDPKDTEFDMPFQLDDSFKKALEAKEQELKKAAPEPVDVPVCTPNEEGVCEMCSG